MQVLGLSHLQVAALAIAFNPIYWNIVAQYEHRTRALSNAVGPYNGCYLLAVSIFLLGLFRDRLYHDALAAAPSAAWLTALPHRLLGGVLFLAGNALVLPSMYALGVTGTYLGDYFGILMNARVTSYPFNVTDNPMYWGSALCFLGTAIYYAKPIGILLTLEVVLMYVAALRFEEPYTAAIYAARDKALADGGGGGGGADGVGEVSSPRKRGRPKKDTAITPTSTAEAASTTTGAAAAEVKARATRARLATPELSPPSTAGSGSGIEEGIRRSPRKHKA